MLVFKQFILPILDYRDFLFDSATKDSLDNLDKIQKRAIRIIDNGAHAAHTQEAKELHYGLRPLCQRRHEHHLLIMYRLSHVVEYLDVDRSEIVLRNRNKIKFNSEVTKLPSSFCGFKVKKSPIDLCATFPFRLGLISK